MSHTLKSPARARALTRLAPVAAALLTAACAESGLDAAAIEITEPSWIAEASASGSTVTVSELPPVTAQPVPEMAPPAQVAGTAGPASLPKAPQASSLRPETLAAIRDARALRAAGNRARALGMLEKIDGADTDPALLLERGLLTLELGQADRAVELLTQAQDPEAPDWRAHSGLGAALSAQGKQQAAQAEFAKALAIVPDNPAVLNNLALSYALDGKHIEAERMLRRASEQGSSPQARQNLALIVGLRGNVAEARSLSEGVLPPDKARANVAYFEELRTGGSERVSRPDTLAPSEDAVRAAVAAVEKPASDQPIMRLGAEE
jgi:Flp pilus assembly protein TadD